MSKLDSGYENISKGGQIFVMFFFLFKIAASKFRVHTTRNNLELGI